MFNLLPHLIYLVVECLYSKLDFLGYLVPLLHGPFRKAWLVAVAYPCLLIVLALGSDHLFLRVILLKLCVTEVYSLDSRLLSRLLYRVLFCYRDML